MRRLLATALVLMPLVASTAFAAERPGHTECATITESATPGDFPIVATGRAATVCVDPADHKAAQIAAGLLTDDIERVTGVRPIASATAPKDGTPVILVGTLGKSALIDGLVRDKKLDAEAIRGRWEAFTLAVVDNPMPGVGRALVVAGSDRRGTAFGAVTLSEAMGVSPWYWWADVVPAKKKELHLAAGAHGHGSPSVKYRGIFINDEDYAGLKYWAGLTLDKKIGNIGPRTYEKIFELLLRLKANYLWPAMHGGSHGFARHPENARLADDYGIVMGTSHCEQMLRNNVDEWKIGYGKFNYITNRQDILDYWSKGVAARASFENTYTLGLRGVHDTTMEGVPLADVAKRTAVTRDAIAEQRAMLKKSVNPDPTQVPQILCAYKEVLDVYQNGLEPADDITLMWADDNHGFIRQLSTPAEQKRSGGAGVYYHLSYHGTPESWLWLSSISPGLLAYEMQKAYAFGADRAWVFNIGDIKPGEKEMTFAMEMAYDRDRWTTQNAGRFIHDWSAKTFGPETADDIAAIMDGYYRLAASGKPEHVRWIDYPESEVVERLRAYRELREKAAQVRERIPARLRDAYFELVQYPVSGAGLMNDYFLAAKRSVRRAARGDAGALDDAKLSRAAYDELNRLDVEYAQNTASGKWPHLISWRPVETRRSKTYDVVAATPELLAQAASLPPAFSPDLASAALQAPMRLDNGVLRGAKDKSKAGSATLEWNGDADGTTPLWVLVSTPPRNGTYCSVEINGKTLEGAVKPVAKIWHLDQTLPTWHKLGDCSVRKGTNRLVLSSLRSGAAIYGVHFGLVPPVTPDAKSVTPAANFLRKQDTKDASVAVLPQLGLGEGVGIMPFTAPTIPEARLAEAPWVEYEVAVPAGKSRLVFHALPTQRIHEGRDVRYAVSVDGGKPAVYDIRAAEFVIDWCLNVLYGYTEHSVEWNAEKAGKVVVRVSFPDSGVVLRDITVTGPAPRIRSQVTGEIEDRKN